MNPLNRLTRNLLLMTFAAASLSVSANEKVIAEFSCVNSEDTVLIVMRANNEVSLEEEGGLPCLYELEEIKGQYDKTSSGEFIKYELLAKQCASAGVVYNKEIMIHHYDHWKPDSHPIATIKRKKNIYRCNLKVHDITTLKALQNQLEEPGYKPQ